MDRFFRLFFILTISVLLMGQASSRIRFKTKVEGTGFDSLKTDALVDKAGSGAPSFTNGLKFADSTINKYKVVTSYSATVTGFSDVSSINIHYTIIGNAVTVHVPEISGTSNATTFQVAVPSEIQTNVSTDQGSLCAIRDNGTWDVGRCFTNSSLTYIDFWQDLTTATFTNSGIKACRGFILTYLLN